LILAHRPNVRRLTDEVADRDLLPIGEPNARIAGHALTQIRHHRLLLDPLLDASVQL
jgi:hypothetical protein